MIDESSSVVLFYLGCPRILRADMGTESSLESTTNFRQTPIYENFFAQLQSLISNLLYLKCRTKVPLFIQLVIFTDHRIGNFIKI